MKDPYKKIEESKKCIYKCTPVIVGPTGPPGIDEVADKMVVRNTYTGEAGSSARVIDNKVNDTHILDFVLPKGEDGQNIPLKSAYIVTFNENTSPQGIEVLSNSNIPLKRVELDVYNLIGFDPVKSLIKFNLEGYYKIYFTVSAYPEVHGQDFDPTKDIVSVGFRETNTDHIYVGVGEFVYNGEPVELSATGIVAVVDTAVTYELANLGKYTIYLETPDIQNISSKSYFANPLVTMVIDYLGKSVV